MMNGINEKNDDFRIIGQIHFNHPHHRASRIDGNTLTSLNLTSFEYRLLYFLSSHAGEVFSRATILKNILQSDVHVKDENIYTHISSLRKKMGDLSSTLERIPRVGYCIKIPKSKAA